MTSMRKIWAICLLGLAIQASAESVWVSDQFEVMLRTGPSTSNAIDRMLPSGTALEVLERDAEAGYARVRTAAGTEGWVLARYLMAEPSAREQLMTLTKRLTSAKAAGGSLASQLDAIKGEYDRATRRISKLERNNSQLEASLADIKRTSSNVLSINSQNKELRNELEITRIQADAFEQQNRELTSQTTRYWFLTGAIVLIFGMVLGVWVPRIKWQRRSRYDSF